MSPTSQHFPPDVREALQRAAAIADPDARLKAIDAATTSARRQYAEFFRRPPDDAEEYGDG